MRSLETQKDFVFISYPAPILPDLTHYCMLTLDAPPLSKKEADLGILLIDGTWRYAEKMVASVLKRGPVITRSLPGNAETAYPRCQTGCIDPKKGLASIEALYIAFLLTGRSTQGLLDGYYWQEEFLQKNHSLSVEDLGE